MILFALNNTIRKPKKKDKIAPIDKNLLKMGLKKTATKPAK